MKYLILIYGNDEIWNSADPAAFAELLSEVDTFNADLRDSGELVDTQGLTDRPRSVRMTGGTPIITDGPYLEAKEHIGSYFIVDVDTEERATQIATNYPALRYSRNLGGGLEIWPLMTD